MLHGHLSVGRINPVRNLTLVNCWTSTQNYPAAYNNQPAVLPNCKLNLKVFSTIIEVGWITDQTVWLEKVIMCGWLSLTSHTPHTWSDFFNGMYNASCLLGMLTHRSVVGWRSQWVCVRLGYYWGYCHCERRWLAKWHRFRSICFMARLTWYGVRLLTRVEI